MVNFSMQTCDDILSRFNWGGKGLVHSVENVRYSFLKRFPPVLVISADGWVSTRRSSDPELRAVAAEVASKEGVLELAFVSNLQGDADEKSLQRIHAVLEWRDSPETFHQITVHSNTNQITTIIGRA
jgi:hypothetical protein